MVKSRKKRTSGLSNVILVVLALIVLLVILSNLNKYHLSREQSKDMQMEARNTNNFAYINAGYVTPGLDFLRYPSEKFPVRGPVTTKIHHQAGPELWDSTNQVIQLPDKAKVITEGSPGSGKWWNAGLVKGYCTDCNNPETYVINRDELVERDYWNCSSFSSWTEALKYGQVVTRLSNSKAEVIRAGWGWGAGRRIDPATFDHSKIFCLSEHETHFMGSSKYTGKVLCYIYELTDQGRTYKATSYFNPEDLVCMGQ